MLTAFPFYFNSLLQQPTKKKITMRASEINALMKMGFSDVEIKRLAKSIKGKVTTISTAGTTSDALQIGGNAAVLLGFRAFDPNGLNLQMNIMINQEVIYSSVEENLLDSVLSSCNEEYIETFRRIKPVDVINVDYIATAGTTCNLMVFYLTLKTN